VIVTPQTLAQLSRFLETRRFDRVLEWGCGNAVGGGASHLFTRADYRGLDIEPGPGVDFVLPQSGVWPAAAGDNDLVFSVNVFEHVAQPWLTMRQLAGAVRAGGMAYIQAPFSFPYHRHPIDAWRFGPDGMVSLGNHAGLRTETAYLYHEASALRGAISDLCWFALRGQWRNMRQVLREYPTRPPAIQCVGVFSKP
jgi:hypothetical protein